MCTEFGGNGESCSETEGTSVERKERKEVKKRGRQSVGERCVWKRNAAERAAVWSMPAVSTRERRGPTS